MVTVADRLNNEIGRRIAERLSPKVSVRDVAKEVLRVFRDEGLYVASFPERGTITISREKITQKQWEDYNGLLKQLDEEGNFQDSPR